MGKGDIPREASGVHFWSHRIISRCFGMHKCFMNRDLAKEDLSLLIRAAAFAFTFQYL